jgi:hypothetical protein
MALSEGTKLGRYEIRSKIGAGGYGNIGGNYNSAIGYFARPGSDNLTNATAIGANAQVNASNSLVLGSIGGVNGATGDTKVGIGTTAPLATLHVVAPSTVRFSIQTFSSF